MAVVIEHSDGSSTRDYWQTCIVKSSGGVFVPQLFYDKRPILYATSLSGISMWNKMLQPKVTSQKWKCFTHDLSQSSIPQYSTAASNLRWNVSGNIYWPRVENHVVKDLNSGLTAALEDMKAGSNTWSNSSVRVARSSISTNYINVFAWSVWNKNTVLSHGMPMMGWDNNGYSDIYVADRYAYNDGHLNFTDGKIDNQYWGLYQYHVTLVKPSSGTYLHVAPPMARNATETMSCMGWGMVLEPTNDNTYPES